MIRGASKFLSMRFLENLKADNYISAGRIEYCAEEVDELLTVKKCNSAMKYEAEQMKTLYQLAMEMEEAKKLKQLRKKRKVMERIDRMSVKQLDNLLKESVEIERLINEAFPAASRIMKADKSKMKEAYQRLERLLK